MCCTFGPKGHWESLFNYRWVEPDINWWTMWPPATADHTDSTWVQFLIVNHWLNESTYQWVGPPSPAPVQIGKSSKGKGKGKQTKFDAWKRLRDCPNAYSDPKGAPSVISLLASQVACDHFGGWKKAEDSTERVRNTRKKHIMMYKMRYFASHSIEVLKYVLAQNHLVILLAHA